jgi:hypothetical protein
MSTHKSARAGAHSVEEASPARSSSEGRARQPAVQATNVSTFVGTNATSEGAEQMTATTQNPASIEDSVRIELADLGSPFTWTVENIAKAAQAYIAEYEHGSVDVEAFVDVETVDGLAEAVIDFVRFLVLGHIESSPDMREFVKEMQTKEREWQPIIDALEARDIKASVEQTGGGVWCVIVPFAKNDASNAGMAWGVAESTWGGNDYDGQFVFTTGVPSDADPAENAEALADAIAAAYYTLLARYEGRGFTEVTPR